MEGKSGKRLYDRIGVMQGRLCELVDNKIQAFPENEWREEFSRAHRLGLSLIEWTLDNDSIDNNPLINKGYFEELTELKRRWEVTIPSVTGDCFMQNPMWKDPGNTKAFREYTKMVLDGCAQNGAKVLVIPLVDKSSLKCSQEERVLTEALLCLDSYIRSKGLIIAFESDYSPTELADFIRRFPIDTFGINYDCGNSGSLGYDCVEEFDCYGDRIVNVHVKDRVKGGTTVPLGEGSVDFEKVFSGLGRLRYNGNFILQTARAADGDHMNAVRKYADMVNAYRWGSL